MVTPCILLIDDDVKLLAKMELTLRRAGYRVLTAHEGRQAVYLLAQGALPEVIVCDATMSSLNGFEVKQHSLKTHKRHRSRSSSSIDRMDRIHASGAGNIAPCDKQELAIWK